MFKASCFAVFGDEFPCDDLYAPYEKFEAGLSNYMKGYPRLLDREGFSAKENVHSLLTEFFKHPSKANKASKVVLQQLKVTFMITLLWRFILTFLLEF